MVATPILVLFYFIYYDPLHQLTTSASETSEQISARHGDHFYKLDTMSSVYVRTKAGTVQGERLEVLNRETDIFLGIPFAEPPVGDLRFRKPKDVKPWSGTYRAIRHAKPCLQFKSANRPKDTPWTSDAISSEDCLYLNIWAPGYKAANQLKPVMIWIYGGGFSAGSADVEFYDGGVLSAHGDVVVVTFNYRLGVFGFLSVNHESSPGNMGLHDQAAALKWVKANIEAFGGDPDKVTLFGQSSGAFSVGYHLMSPITRNLFNRAILQSGSPLNPQVLEDPNSVLDRAQQLAIRVSCANERINIYKHADDVVSCLRKLEANFLAKNADEMFIGFHAPFGVSVGNEFLPVNPYEAIKHRDLLGSKKEILIGSNRDEGSYFLHWTYPKIFTAKNPKKVSAEQAIPLLEEAFKFLPAPGSRIVSHFFMNDMNSSDYGQIRQRLYETIGDFVVLCPQVYFGELMSAKNFSVNYYFYTHRPSNTRWGKWMGVAHFDEVAFVFGTPFIRPNEYSDEERTFSTRLMDTWVNFAKTG